MFTRRASVPALACAILVGVTAPLAGQAAPSLTGTWKLNLAKSTYSPSNLAPKSGTTRFEVTQDAVTAVVDGIDSQGRKTHQEYTAKLDGKNYPCGCTIDGQPNANQDAVAYKKVDDRTYELTATLKGQVLTITRIVIAPDGKSRTNTVTGKNAQGQTVNNIAVYDRQ